MKLVPDMTERYISYLKSCETSGESPDSFKVFYKQLNKIAREKYQEQEKERLLMREVL